jgi:ribonuclease-3
MPYCVKSMISCGFMSHGSVTMSKTTEFMKAFLDDGSEIEPEEIELYKKALTHSSNNDFHNNNQRLAFLGDSVLRLIIREHFYEKYPEWDKGKLTKYCAGNDGETGIEQNGYYAQLAIKLKIVDFMDIENPTFETTNETVNAEAFEALFGALYLSRGLEETKRIARKHILDNIEIP